MLTNTEYSNATALLSVLCIMCMNTRVMLIEDKNYASGFRQFGLSLFFWIDMNYVPKRISFNAISLLSLPFLHLKKCFFVRVEHLVRSQEARRLRNKETE